MIIRLKVQFKRVEMKRKWQIWSLNTSTIFRL